MKLRENIILFGHIPQSTDVAIVNLEAPVTARGRPVSGGGSAYFSAASRGMWKFEPN